MPVIYAHGFISNRIPKVRVLEIEEGSREIELSDDPYDCIRLNVENVPCIITLSKVSLEVVNLFFSFICNFCLDFSYKD